MKLIILLALMLPFSGVAEVSYQSSRRLSLKGHELLNLSKDRTSALDNYKVIDLSANIEVGASCGEMNVATNLKANLKDLLDDQFFNGLGNKIQNAGGMLALCYLSPSYCAIAKHMRMSSHFLSQLNLDSCSMIDKYTDSRVADYELTKQQCVRQEMDRNGRDVKSALEKCSNGADALMDWSGASSGTVASNDLLGATAKWAGMSGDDVDRLLDSTKAMVGNTVVAKGGMQVDFGSREKLVTPRELIAETAEEQSRRIGELVGEMSSSEGRTMARASLDQKLSETFGPEMDGTVAYEVARKLSYMPRTARNQAVGRLSKALASERVVQNAEKSIEILSLASRNPNLPPTRQQEAIQLRQQLKDQLAMTLEMRKGERDQLANVIAAIGSEGGEFEGDYGRRNLESASARQNGTRLKELFYDCSDGVFCKNGGE